MKPKVNTYKTIILQVLLYGCETWPLTFREKHRLRMFKRKVLSKIFGATRHEITGECRKLHNAGHLACLEKSRNAYRVSVENVKERNHYGGRDVDGRTILKWI